MLLFILHIYVYYGQYMVLKRIHPCTIQVVFHKQYNKHVQQYLSCNVWWDLSYRLCDVNFQYSSGTEGREASISSLDHHRPPAVFPFSDVLHNLHRFDEWFQLDLTSGCVDVKDVVWIGFHNGVFNEIIRFLCVVIHGLNTNPKPGPNNLIHSWVS